MLITSNFNRSHISNFKLIKISKLTKAIRKLVVPSLCTFLVSGNLYAEDKQLNQLNTNYIPSDIPNFQKYLPQNTQVLDVLTSIRNGLEYHSIKYLNEKDQITSMMVDPTGQTTQNIDMPDLPVEQIGANLKEALSRSSDDMKHLMSQ